MDKLAVAKGLAAMTEDELYEEVAKAAAALPLDHEKMAHELAAGVRAPEAARRAGLSDQGGRCYERARRPDVQRLVLALRESARRQTVVTVAGQIQHAQHIARLAEEKGDLPTMLASSKEVSRLAGLYPEHGSGDAPVSTSIRIVIPPPRQIPAFPGAPVQPALPEPQQPTGLRPAQPASRAVVEVVAPASLEDLLA